MWVSYSERATESSWCIVSLLSIKHHVRSAHHHQRPIFFFRHTRLSVRAAHGNSYVPAQKTQMGRHVFLTCGCEHWFHLRGAGAGMGKRTPLGTLTHLWVVKARSVCIFSPVLRNRPIWIRNSCVCRVNLVPLICFERETGLFWRRNWKLFNRALTFWCFYESLLKIIITRHWCELFCN